MTRNDLPLEAPRHNHRLGISTACIAAFAVALCMMSTESDMAFAVGLGIVVLLLIFTVIGSAVVISRWRKR